MLYIVKLFYAWLLPPGLFLLFLLIAYVLYNKTRKVRYFFVAFALVYLLSIGFVCNPLLKPLENYYMQPDLSALQEADAIVVLGGGSVGGVTDFDGEGQVGADPANRLFMGIRLHRALNLPIILSGGQVFSYTGTEADIEYRLLKSAGVDEKFLLKENRSRNTVENARFTKQLCEKMGFNKVILVTSGYHLPRSVLIFEREGMCVIPYPTDYKIGKEFVVDAFSFTPSSGCLNNSALAMREYLGILAIKVGAQ